MRPCAIVTWRPGRIALRALVPGLSSAEFCALCVTETGGNHPRDIQTAIVPADNGYRPGFAAELMLKDLRLAQLAAEAADADTPMGKAARDLYEAMETARCEAMGARDMPGTAGNIDAKIAHEAQRLGYDQVTQAADAPLATAAGYLIRHLATGRDLPGAAQNVMDLWRGHIEDQAGETLGDLNEILSLADKEREDVIVTLTDTLERSRKI